jgi:hypothetical protein
LKQTATNIRFSTPNLSRRYHLHQFSQKSRCGWENIWRKVAHISHLNNVSSNLFQIILSGWCRLLKSECEQMMSSAQIWMWADDVVCSSLNVFHSSLSTDKNTQFHRMLKCLQFLDAKVLKC